MDNSSYYDSYAYYRRDDVALGVFLGLTEDALLAVYGTQFSDADVRSRLYQALDARADSLIAEYSPRGVIDSPADMSSALRVAQSAVNDLTGQYGGTVEEEVLRLLRSIGSQAAVERAQHSLQEACSQMSRDDQRRLSGAIGVLMLATKANVVDKVHRVHGSSASTQPTLVSTARRLYAQRGMFNRSSLRVSAAKAGATTRN